MFYCFEIKNTIYFSRLIYLSNTHEGVRTWLMHLTMIPIWKRNTPRHFFIRISVLELFGYMGNEENTWNRSTLTFLDWFVCRVGHLLKNEIRLFFLKRTKKTVARGKSHTVAARPLPPGPPEPPDPPDPPEPAGSVAVNSDRATSAVWGGATTARMSGWADEPWTCNWWCTWCCSISTLRRWFCCRNRCAASASFSIIFSCLCGKKKKEKKKNSTKLDRHWTDVDDNGTLQNT